MSRGTAKDVAKIVSAAGEIVGRTRLQKTVVLLEMTGLGYGFEFQYYKFGPYSDDLLVSTERAVALDYIEEDEGRAAWGGRYSIFRSKVRQATDSAERDQLIDLAKDADSIVLELAVTAAFLAAEGEKNAWAELAERKPEKVTRARLSAAKDLYRKFMEVSVPQALPEIA